MDSQVTNPLPAIGLSLPAGKRALEALAGTVAINLHANFEHFFGRWWRLFLLLLLLLKPAAQAQVGKTKFPAQLFCR